MGCGASADKVDPEGVNGGVDFKPVHSAVRWNNSLEEVVSALDTSESVNCRDSGNGNRPIHIAAQNGHTDILELLVQREALLDAVNMKGNTALHMAVEYDYYDACKLLLDAGADPAVKNDDGHACLVGIEGEKSMAVVQLLCSKITEDVIDALTKCNQDQTNIEKAAFAQAGLKVKRSMGAQWTDEAQTLFKGILAKL
jgi:ankyrin repeat protein